MKIATILNAHGNTELVSDTVDAIRTWVSKDVLMVVDDVAWKSWGETVALPVYKLQGFLHDFDHAPYRNLTLGLKAISDLWPDCDWYCYCEYDVLFTSSAFKDDLAKAKKDNIWCLGSNFKEGDMKFELLEKIIKEKIDSSQYLLGCCVFYSGEFIKKLKQIDFFNRFLAYTNDFSEGFFPFYEIQGGYDFGEHLYPTLAKHYGGGIKEFSYWHQNFAHWNGDFKKYPLRWKPELTWEDNFKEASIMHPVKAYDAIRWFHRVNRNRKLKHGQL